MELLFCRSLSRLNTGRILTSLVWWTTAPTPFHILTRACQVMWTKMFLRSTTHPLPFRNSLIRFGFPFLAGHWVITVLRPRFFETDLTNSYYITLLNFQIYIVADEARWIRTKYPTLLIALWVQTKKFKIIFLIQFLLCCTMHWLKLSYTP